MAFAEHFFQERVQPLLLCRTVDTTGILNIEIECFCSCWRWIRSYKDYHTCKVVYVCGKVNLITRMCDLPRFYINTRIRLDLLTHQHKKVVDDIVDRVLNPYCLGVKDLVADIWGPQYAEPCVVAPLSVLRESDWRHKSYPITLQDFPRPTKMCGDVRLKNFFCNL